MFCCSDVGSGAVKELGVACGSEIGFEFVSGRCVVFVCGDGLMCLARVRDSID